MKIENGKKESLAKEKPNGVRRSHVKKRRALKVNRKKLSERQTAGEKTMEQEKRKITKNSPCNRRQQPMGGRGGRWERSSVKGGTLKTTG